MHITVRMMMSITVWLIASMISKDYSSYNTTTHLKGTNYPRVRFSLLVELPQIWALNNWMTNHTPKPIVFKYFLRYLLVRVRKEWFQFTKIYTNRELILHSELFVDTSIEVYSQNNPYASIRQSIGKNRIKDDGLFDHR